MAPTQLSDDDVAIIIESFSDLDGMVAALAVVFRVFLVGGQVQVFGGGGGGLRDGRVVDFAATVSIKQSRKIW
jgi:hypothetical protein